MTGGGQISEKSINVINIIVSEIGTAPIIPGESFGPCLLAPGRSREWDVGFWDGYYWIGSEGLPVAPRFWAALPALRELEKAG